MFVFLQSILFFTVLLQKLGSHLAPSDEGDSPQCGEMSQSDRGDRRRQRLSSKARLRERKDCGFMRFYFSPSVFLLTQKATSQLPFRSVLLSLRLEIATGNPHPRQREARSFGIKFISTNPDLFF